MYPNFLFLCLWIVIFGSQKSFLQSVNENCDFYQDIDLGQEYFIYNPEYPKNYSLSCQWTGTSPWGTVVVISCNDVTLPYSKNCEKDKLAFSPNGDENYNNAEYYCGKTTFTAVTHGNRFAVGLFPTDGSVGGSFVCSLAAMRVGPQNCNCGFKGQMKIVGGEETGENEFPYMAGLMDVSKDEVFCGTSVIAKRYAVTAAHCLRNQSPNNLQLLVGVHNLNSYTTDSHRLNIASFIAHPSFDTSTQHNDIAIVKTNTEIIFNLAVSPICLPFIYREYNFLDETVVALGWGYTDLSGDKADSLQKVDLGVVSNQQCDGFLPEEIVATQVCTFADGKDACISDSGGPLCWQDSYSRKIELVGIISYGLGCATVKPAVNTRVTSFLSWIASVTSDAEFCIR